MSGSELPSDSEFPAETLPTATIKFVFYLPCFNLCSVFLVLHQGRSRQRPNLCMLPMSLLSCVLTNNVLKITVPPLSCLRVSSLLKASFLQRSSRRRSTHDFSFVESLTFNALLRSPSKNYSMPWEAKESSATWGLCLASLCSVFDCTSFRPRKIPSKIYEKNSRPAPGSPEYHTLNPVTIS